MERRNFVSKSLIGAGLAAGSLIGCGGKNETANKNKASAKKFKWRLVMVVPKTLKIWGPGIVNFAKKVKIMSQGRLDIKVYGAKEFVDATEVFDAVHRGQAEMGHGAAYYWRGKMKSSVFFTSVPFGTSANGMLSWLKGGGGQELWDELYAAHGVKPFPCGSTGCQMGGWYRKEINSLNDFKGIKIRMPGLGGDVISKVGAEPVFLPGGEIFTSLQTGVIDACEWVGPYHDYLMGFHKVAKYYYMGGWHEPGSILEMTINKDAWESLPEDLQLIVKSCIAETSNEMYYEWLARDAEYYQRLKKEGQVVFKSFPDDVIKKLKVIADKELMAIGQSDELSKRIYQSFTRFKKEYDAFMDISERAYENSVKRVSGS